MEGYTLKVPGALELSGEVAKADGVLCSEFSYTRIGMHGSCDSKMDLSSYTSVLGDLSL